MKFREITSLWKAQKQHYIKKSSYSAYCLLLENHILPWFAEHDFIAEFEVQDFVLAKVEKGLSVKTIKDMIIVLNMVLKFGHKRNIIEYKPFELIYPTNHESKKN
ncbi:hypothetical protein QQ054_31990 [Oscillatoria amoena NRMC-F 0135]|nr:hypothetical protein [Oscillatoria amoena NRMC-F 0135]